MFDNVSRTKLFFFLKEKAVTCLLTLLSEETESFPRRAAMKVFVSLVKSSSSFTASDKFLNSVLLVGVNDFDWEVKVYTLELADVLIERILEMQELKKLKDWGLFDLLLKFLFDCDRPVAQKACVLLLKLKTLLNQKSDAHHVLNLEVYGHSWSDEVLQRCHNKPNTESRCEDDEDIATKQTDVDNHCLPKEMDICTILELLDLDELQHTLLLSSDYMVNSAKSVMEDILFVAKCKDENVIDCY